MSKNSTIDSGDHCGSHFQGSKLTLADSQNGSDFDNLRVRKISISKNLQVGITKTSSNVDIVYKPTAV